MLNDVLKNAAQSTAPFFFVDVMPVELLTPLAGMGCIFEDTANRFYYSKAHRVCGALKHMESINNF